jgi:hypothetical protein
MNGKKNLQARAAKRLRHLTLRKHYPYVGFRIGTGA